MAKLSAKPSARHVWPTIRPGKKKNAADTDDHQTRRACVFSQSVRIVT